jgi:hypothetical protein
VANGDVPLTSKIQSWLRIRHAKNEQFRQAVRAMNVDGIRGLSSLSDVELIATDPSIPGAKHQMEMQQADGRRGGADGGPGRQELASQPGSRAPSASDRDF